MQTTNNPLTTADTIKLSTANSITTASEGTCVDNCGNHDNYNCCCDDLCIDLEDCCPDYIDVCATTSTSTSTSPSASTSSPILITTTIHIELPYAELSQLYIYLLQLLEYLGGLLGYPSLTDN